jgi:hypothetical protein
LQIGKDDDKKESKYQKNMYYASNGYQYYGESGQTPIQNYFDKVLYENLTFEIPPLWIFRVAEGLKKNRNQPL